VAAGRASRDYRPIRITVVQIKLENSCKNDEFNVIVPGNAGALLTNYLLG
jgi:hypothetical protein